MLIHSAVLNQLTSKSDFRNKTYGGDINLTFVRVEPVVARKLNASGEYASTNTYKVFYDSTNSRPKDVVFSKGDKFTFGGNNLTVNEVQTFYAFDGVTFHHHEIECL